MTRYEIGGAIFIGSSIVGAIASAMNVHKMRKMSKTIKKNNEELHKVMDRMNAISMDEHIINSEDINYMAERYKEMTKLAYEGKIVI